MKKVLMLMLLSAVGVAVAAQKQKVSVGKNGEMIVNGDTVAYIEKEGCKLLSAICQFIITDENDDPLLTVSLQSFTDKERKSPQFPNGTPTTYLLFSFKGYDEVAETDAPFSPKELSVAKLVARWRLIRDKKLDPESVNLFIAANGRRFSEKELLQSQPPVIQINMQ